MYRRPVVFLVVAYIIGVILAWQIDFSFVLLYVLIAVFLSSYLFLFYRYSDNMTERYTRLFSTHEPAVPPSCSPQGDKKAGGAIQDSAPHVSAERNSVICGATHFNVWGSTGLLLAMVILSGSLIYSHHTKLFQGNHIKHFVCNKLVPVELVGALIKDIEVNDEKHRSYLTVKLESIHEEKVSGNVRVITSADIQPGDYIYGDRLKIKGRLFAPMSFKGFDYKVYLERKKVFGLVLVIPKKNEWIEKIGSGYGNPLLPLVYKLKHKIIKIIHRSMPEGRYFNDDLWQQSLLQVQLLEGILLGNDKALPRKYREIFRDTGTIHIMAVSGFNVSLVIFMVFLILRVFRLPKTIRCLLTIFFVIIFAIITGMSPSVLRASVMAITILVGLMLDRDIDLYNILSFSALIILIVSPLEIFDIGFQLSYIATLFIIYFAPKWIEWGKKIEFLPGWLKDIIAVCLAAQVGVFPLLAFYFQKISAISIIANIVIAPVVGFITALGFITSLIGLGSIYLAKVFAACNWLFLTLLLEIVQFFNSFPFAVVNIPKLHIAYITCIYLVIIIVTHINILKQYLWSPTD